MEEIRHLVMDRRRLPSLSAWMMSPARPARKLTVSRLLSTESVSSSILQYRTLHGRTFHSDRYADVQYFTPNDDQQQTSIDITCDSSALNLCNELTLY